MVKEVREPESGGSPRGLYNTNVQTLTISRMEEADADNITGHRIRVAFAVRYVRVKLIDPLTLTINFRPE